ncbi:MAG: hypothetical protein R3B70_29165 [Polyangiaceae bacterium]
MGRVRGTWVVGAGALSLAALGGASGCGAGEDPCGAVEPAAVEVGTGVTAFEAVGDDGIEVGKAIRGYHLWVALRLRGFAPKAVAQIGAYDIDTGESLTYEEQRSVLQLEAGADGVAEIAGLRAVLTGDALPDLAGRKIRVSATVEDSCPATATGEVLTFISDVPPEGGWPGEGGAGP